MRQSRALHRGHPAFTLVTLAAFVLALGARAQDRAEIARGVVQVLTEVAVNRNSNNEVTIITVHMQANADQADDLARQIAYFANAKPGFQLAPPKTMSVASGVAAANTLVTQAPSSIVVYNVEASIVAVIGSRLRGTRILTITTKPDDTSSNRVCVAVTGRSAVLQSTDLLHADGFDPLNNVPVALSPESASDKWYEPYREGRRIINLAGGGPNDWQDAANHMREALRIRPREAKELVPRIREPYVPHFYLAKALYALGQYERALSELAASEDQAVIFDFEDMDKELRDLKTKCLNQSH
jgi:hypothetical protein